MNKKTIATIQYTEAILLNGLIKLFLRPIVSGADNLKNLVDLAGENCQSIVIISNHINAYDPLYISSALSELTGRQLYPVWLPAKKRFFSNPLKRFLMNCHGCLPVGIGRDEDSLRSLKSIIEKINAGDVICVFPEGQVSRDGTMGKDMGFVSFLARRNDFVVQPVYLSGITGFKDELRQILLRKRQLHIVFGKPIMVKKGSSIDSIKLICEASA